MISVFKNVFLSVKTHNKLLVFCSLSEGILGYSSFNHIC